MPFSVKNRVKTRYLFQLHWLTSDYTLLERLPQCARASGMLRHVDLFFTLENAALWYTIKQRRVPRASNEHLIEHN